VPIAQSPSEAIEEPHNKREQGRASALVVTMAEEAPPAGEDVQPLSAPKFPKLKSLSLEDRILGATE
jgi:hypothetical protein